MAEVESPPIRRQGGDRVSDPWRQFIGGHPFNNPKSLICVARPAGIEPVFSPLKGTRLTWAHSFLRTVVSFLARFQDNHIPRIGGFGTIICPSVHKSSPLIKEITLSISSFRFILDDVRQRHFDDLARKASSFGSPIPKCRAEAMRRDIAAVHAA